MLDKIAMTLIEEEKINGVQLIDLINDVKPNLVPEAAMDAVK